MRRLGPLFLVLGVVLMLWPAQGGAAQPVDDAERALQAALRIFDGVPEADCTTNNPELKACIGLRSTPEEAARGIAVLSLGDPLGGGAMVVLGRDASGAWGYWFGTQQLVYQLLVLPGEMMVCADGDSLNVRALPSLDAPVLDQLAHLTAVTAEEFVLTTPGSLAPMEGASGRGDGWYRLSAPVEGWAAARFLSNTSVDASLNQPLCFWHNLMNQVR